MPRIIQARPRPKKLHRHESGRKGGAADTRKQQREGGLRKPFLFQIISALGSNEAPAEAPKIAPSLPAVSKA